MKVAFFSSEVFPYAKTGGLADVCGALPAALGQLGVEVVVIAPRYRTTRKKAFGQKRVNGVWETRPAENVRVWFVDNDALYDRPHLYGDRDGDYPDNLERFRYFCWEGLDLLKQQGWQPDIVHGHDWQTSLVSAFLVFRLYNDPFFANIKSVLTVHNLAYQGVFPPQFFGELQLDPTIFQPDGFEFYGKINLLKAGIIYSDEVTTVSPTYAREILDPEFGCGLEGVLRSRRRPVHGILNGLDEDVWDPAADRLITANFSAADLAGKAANKAELQRLSGLPVRPDVPLFGWVGRLSHQKGIDLLAGAAKHVLKQDVQMVIQGVGERKYEDILGDLAARFPEQVTLHFRFSEDLAHQIYAGSDFFLIPSVYEPCGLSQMISMRYGTVPVVHRTGGLADTVRPFGKKGNGFVFTRHSPSALGTAMDRAIEAYGTPAIDETVRRNFDVHFTWERAAREYLRIYERALATAKG